MTLINPDEHKTRVANGETSTAIKIKQPKRILHFCDGVLEEYSTDEEENTTPKPAEELVDPSKLAWGPWFWYRTWRAGAGTVSALDSMGEFFASFFGITTPKYYFELEEYRRREAEQKAENEKKEGWSEASGAENFKLKEITTSQPKPVDV